MSQAKQNLTYLLKRVAPDANIVVAGEFVQGTMTPEMARLVDLRNAIRSIPQDAIEADVHEVFLQFGKHE